MVKSLIHHLIFTLQAKEVNYNIFNEIWQSKWTEPAFRSELALLHLPLLSTSNPPSHLTASKTFRPERDSILLHLNHQAFYKILAKYRTTTHRLALVTFNQSPHASRLTTCILDFSESCHWMMMSYLSLTMKTPFIYQMMRVGFRVHVSRNHPYVQLLGDHHQSRNRTSRLKSHSPFLGS